MTPRSIIGLNVRSGGGSRTASILDYLDHQDPSVVVLTEWRQNTSGRQFSAWATRRGMQHCGQTDADTANGVFVASHLPFRAKPVRPTGIGAGTLLLAQFKAFNLLACYFPQRQAKTAFFRRCSELAAAHAATPILLMGDLNTGSDSCDKSAVTGRYFCSNDFDQLTTQHGLHDLWRRTHGAAAREWTWMSNRQNGFRIDHAFANDAFVAQTGPVCRYDHQPRAQKWSDHSAIIVEAGRGSLTECAGTSAPYAISSSM